MRQIDNNLYETVTFFFGHYGSPYHKTIKKNQASEHRKSPLFRFSVCNTQMYKSLIQTAKDLGHSYGSI